MRGINAFSETLSETLSRKHALSLSYKKSTNAQRASREKRAKQTCQDARICFESKNKQPGVVPGCLDVLQRITFSIIPTTMHIDYSTRGNIVIFSWMNYIKLLESCLKLESPFTELASPEDMRACYFSLNSRLAYA